MPLDVILIPFRWPKVTLLKYVDESREICVVRHVVEFTLRQKPVGVDDSMVKGHICD